MNRNKIITFYLDFLEKHPAMRAVDIYKVVYQKFFGPSHLLCDAQKALKFFLDEFNSVKPLRGKIFESIDPMDEIYWAKIPQYKNLNGSPDELWQTVIRTTKIFKPDREGFAKTWIILSDEFHRSGRFESAELEKLSEAPQKKEPPVFHHTNIFINSEKLAYRVVSKGAIRDIGGKMKELFDGDK